MVFYINKCKKKNQKNLADALVFNFVPCFPASSCSCSCSEATTTTTTTTGKQGSRAHDPCQCLGIGKTQNEQDEYSFLLCYSKAFGYG